MELKKCWRQRIGLFIVVLFLIAQSGIIFPLKGLAEMLQKGAMVTVLDQNGNHVIETSAVPFEDGNTASEVLEKIADVTYETTEYGPFLTGINGHVPDGKDYWGFFINGEPATEGAGDYAVRSGDHLLFKIVDGSVWPPASVPVTVTAIDGEGGMVIPETTVTVVEGGTAYDALVQAAKIKGVSVDISLYSDWLASIDGIGDVQLADTEYWAAYMNGRYMQEGLSTYEVSDCDRLYVTVSSFSEGGLVETIEEEVEKSKACTDGDSEFSPPSDETESVTPVSAEKITEAINRTINYLEKGDTLDWYGYIAYRALNKEIPTEAIQLTAETIVDKDGTFRNVTDLEKAILTLTVAGKDAKQVAGYDLISLLQNHERMTNQGNNGIIMALLALDGGNYAVSDDAPWTRERLVQELLANQLDSGAWSLFGDTPSTDITGMALAALSPYQEREDVKESIEKAVLWLSSKQGDTGGFIEPFNGGEASESIAQAIIGLTAIGVDPTGERFTKKEGNLVERLLAFQREDGGFAHLITDDSSNPISSNQALLALAAYKKDLDKEGSVFRLTKETGSLVPIDGESIIHTDTAADETGQGNTLPNTATSNYNDLLYGLILTFAAFIMLFLYRNHYAK